MIGIYKYTNKINGKSYIGQSKDVELRHRQHINSSHKPKYYFDFALNKYGMDNFDFEILEECSEEELNSKEIYYIAKFKSLVSENGYNISKGGGLVNYMQTPVLQIDRETKKVISKFGSTREAYFALGIDCSSISKACLGKRRYAGGYYWCFENVYDEKSFNKYISDYEQQHFLNRSNCFKGKQKNLTPEQRKAIGEKSRLLFKGKKRKPLSEEHKLKLSIAHTGKKYGVMSEKQKENIGRGNGKPIRCVETNEVYYSASEAGRKIGASVANICRCANHEYGYKTAGGFHWEFVERGDVNVT